MLCQLYKARLYMKTGKYEFYSNSVKYLEYILFSFKLTISSNKINQYNPKLAWTKGSQGYASILSICKFLLLIHLQLLIYSCPTDLADIKGYSLELWLSML